MSQRLSYFEGQGISSGVIHFTHHPNDPAVPMNFSRVLSPILPHCMSYLRDRNLPQAQFCQYAKLATGEMVGAALSNLLYKKKEIETPIQHEKNIYAKTTVLKIESQSVLVSILRSGKLMVDVVSSRMPTKYKESFIVIKRIGDDAHAEVKFADICRIRADEQVIVPDPMLATGGSLAEAIMLLKAKGAKEENIVTMHLVSAPEGVMHINKLFPSVRIIVAAMDARLNEQKYICGPGLFPEMGGEGLGDFGDRAYGTQHE